MESRASLSVQAVFLDELSFSATWRLLSVGGLVRVTVLDAVKPSQKICKWILQRKGIDVLEAQFFTGHLRADDGQSIFVKARVEAGSIALTAARKLVSEAPPLNEFDGYYGRDTIVMFLAHRLCLPVEYWTLRSRVTQALSTKGRTVLWIKRPATFDERLVTEAIPEIEHRFYSTIDNTWVGFVLEWARDIAREARLAWKGDRTGWGIDSAALGKPGVLAFQEDHFRFDLELRGQPHWIDRANETPAFNTFILSTMDSKFCNKEDVPHLSRLGVRLMPATALKHVQRAMRHNPVLKRLRADRRRGRRAAICANSCPEKYALLAVALLFRQAELMGAALLYLNIKTVIVGDPQYRLADATILVAPQLGVTTVGYQYSNLAFLTPFMMSKMDKFLVFSEMFRALYRSGSIAPKELLLAGYPYGHVAALVRKKASNHRQKIGEAGASFVVCYFDESVRHNRWGLVGKDDHLNELHVLAKEVLSDPGFGVVVKSQFIFNSPSRLYPEDETIRDAKNTGRFLELQEGAHRNDIFPTEAALVADLCIGHKFGATAALEAALAGVRTVLLETCGLVTCWDAVYEQADIEYKSMESLMAEVARYRKGEPGHQALGDWSPILHHFDPYQDGRAVLRLRTVVEHAVLGRCVETVASANTSAPAPCL